MSDSQGGKEYLTRKQASAYIQSFGIAASVPALNKWARENRGPRFVRYTQYGPTFYPVDGIMEWLGRLDPRRGAVAA